MSILGGDPRNDDIDMGRVFIGSIFTKLPVPSKCSGNDGSCDPQDQPG